MYRVSSKQGQKKGVGVTGRIDTRGRGGRVDRGECERSARVGWRKGKRGNTAVRRVPTGWACGRTGEAAGGGCKYGTWPERLPVRALQAGWLVVERGAVLVWVSRCCFCLASGLFDKWVCGRGKDGGVWNDVK